MRNWFDRLRCWLGFHAGETVAVWGPFVTHQCRRCGHEWKSTRYDV